MCAKKKRKTFQCAEKPLNIEEFKDKADLEVSLAILVSLTKSRKLLSEQQRILCEKEIKKEIRKIFGKK